MCSLKQNICFMSSLENINFNGSPSDYYGDV